MKYYITSQNSDLIVDKSGNMAIVGEHKITRVSEGNGMLEIEWRGKRTKAYYIRRDDTGGDVYIDNWAIPVKIVSETVKRAMEILRANKANASTGIEKIKSPMPGLITKIIVAAGADVKSGDRLCMLEAMKMENEIRSHVNGAVVKINVSERDAVEKGKVLMEIKLT
jgi:biotin carboxyl carrier protein